MYNVYEDCFEFRNNGWGDPLHAHENEGVSAKTVLDNCSFDGHIIKSFDNLDDAIDFMHEQKPVTRFDRTVYGFYTATVYYVMDDDLEQYAEYAAGYRDKLYAVVDNDYPEDYGDSYYYLDSAIYWLKKNYPNGDGFIAVIDNTNDLENCIEEISLDDVTERCEF